MIKRILPTCLKKGDVIGITAPSEPLTEERKVKLAKSISVLNNLGFDLHLGDTLDQNFFYMAGNADFRAKELNSMFSNKEIKAIISAWGGKSANQLIELLDYETIKNNPKFFSGFSDTVNIANAITAKTGLVTFHGPNVAGKLFENDDGSMQFFYDVVTKGESYSIKSNQTRVIREGNAEGILIGGNLSCFTLGVLGTPYEPKYDNIVFFWETGSGGVREIDQYLTYFRLTGFINKIVGMVVGYLSGTNKDDKWGNRDISDALISFSKEYSFPIVQIPTFGHGQLFNPIIPIGSKCVLDTRSEELRIFDYML